jgi:[acyl-carrier-protein] S-malonyltransferase
VQVTFALALQTCTIKNKTGKKMNRAFVFPGQGSQFVGMGKELAENFASAREVFEEVDEALKEKLSKLIFSGVMEELTLTQNTQPALMAVSIAVIRTIEQQGGNNIEKLCSYVAGHSLGEYSALCAAGAISLSDTARLLRIRGNAMAEAVPQGKGGMAALIGVDFELATKIAEKVSEYGICQVANDNGGGQVVISGEIKAIDKAIEIASELGARKAVKLPVSAAFHCSLMQPAANIMREALNEVKVSSPLVPLIANVTADVVTNPDEIKDLLVKQVTGMVRWRESIIKLKEKNIGEISELGAGKVLSGLIKRIDGDINTCSIQSIDDIEKFFASV